jgi:signal transduction histidine kinase
MIDRDRETPADPHLELARLRQRVREQEARLRELTDALAARDAFIATAGHELRNPMGTIIVTVTHVLGLVRQSPAAFPPWLVTRLESLEKHSRLFVRRATTLLDVSRITAGQLRLELETVDLSGVVDDVVEGLAPDAERLRTPLRSDVAPGIIGWWDRAALEQIASNILANALRYGAGKPVSVRLAADDRRVTLAVEDEGIGISEADRARIFQPFERVASERAGGGFGLGLWITRQLVHALGGEIGVESRPGEGSLFTVTLPRAIDGS